jgi:hypothetical protein
MAFKNPISFSAKLATISCAIDHAILNSNLLESYCKSDYHPSFSIA